MKTKLVYVLTCAPEATYIEQALMAVWSARYWNPSAYIVLLVDDKTNELLVGKRSEVLEYVTEKVVVKFEDANASMMYRSRYIKTQVRELIEGDLLFIDCDTIINHSLDEIDNCSYEVAAVPESHLPIEEFHPSLYQSMNENAQKMGWNPEQEQLYFSSGVIYAKDTTIAHQLFQLWHQYWVDGLSKGVKIDQPSLAKANIECGHIIQRIDDKWNCIMFTYPRWAKDAYILHFAAYRNMSFLFSKRVLNYIKENGLTEYIKQYVLHPTESYIPFDSEFYHCNIDDYFRLNKIINRGIKLYAEHMDHNFADFIVKSRLYRLALVLLKKRYYKFASFLIVLSHIYRTKCSVKYKCIENICSR